MTLQPREFVRQSDRPVWWTLMVVGLALIVGAVVLRLAGAISETGATVWAVIGALMMRPDQVLDLIRAKRARSQSGGSDGDEA